MKISIYGRMLSNKHHVYLFFMILIFTMPAAVFSQENETSIADDLYMALTLQGIRCDEISELEQNDDESYEIGCKSGGQYNISQTKDGILNVVDRLRGVVLKGIGKIVDTIPLTEQLFQKEDEVTVHDAEVARSLFSIIRMSGNECEAITDINNKASDEHVVTCAGKHRYRVYTGEDGLVMVDVYTGDGG